MNEKKTVELLYLDIGVVSGIGASQIKKIVLNKDKDGQNVLSVWYTSSSLWSVL